MKLLILSDSHNRDMNIKAVFEKTAKSLNAVIHCGDGFLDAERHAAACSLPYYRVRGNCDAASGSAEEIIELGGVRILLTHGHRYHVKSGYDELMLYAEAIGVSACFFGHTHEPFCLKSDSGVLYLNPGSISYPRHGNPPTYGIADIENGEINGVVVGVFSGGVYRPV